MQDDILKVAEGTVIYEQGTECDSMFLLREGKVGLYLDFGTPKQFALIEMTGPSSSLGEMGLLEGEPRNATAVALTDCTLVEIHTDDFGEFIAAHPDETETIIKDLSHRFKTVMDELKTAQGTIYDFIDELGDRPPKKLSLKERIKRYTDLFLEIPPDVPPDLYMSCYTRFHGSML
ncbi:MAG: Crp/Fnr family transcriptional regulator [Sphaerochaetaceae bacterium]